MSYTCYDADGDLKQIRLLGTDKAGTYCFKNAFTPKHWEIDPCSTPDKRVRVIHPSGIESFYRWYEVVIVGEDSMKDVTVKTEFAEKVAKAIDAVNEAQKALRNLLC